MRLKPIPPCVAVLALVGLVSHGRPASAQDGRPAFEVTSVKESPDGSFAQPPAMTPAGLTMWNRTVVQMVQWAYDLPERDIVGGPAWARTRRYDVAARTAGAATNEQLRIMMRSLLAERFALDAVYESRESPVYALRPSRQDGGLGSEMRPSTATCENVPPEGILRPGGERQRVLRSRYCGVSIASSGGIVFFVSGMRATPGDLARGLSRYLDRPVLDRTGLSAAFDFLLMVSPPGPEVPAAAPAGVEIFRAIQDQLGLELAPDRGVSDVLVIRRLEPPIGN